MAKVKNIHQYVLEGSTFRDLLEKFSGEVYAKNSYDRLPYHDWKTLIRFSKEAFITIIINCDANSILIETSNEYFVVSLNDKSFGEFLFNHFLNDGGSQEMTGNDYLNTCLSSSASISSADKIGNYSSTTSDWNTISIDGTYCNSYLTITDTKADKEDLARVEAKIDEHIRKENEKMKGFNFDFGPMNGNVVRLSMYGLAVKNKTGTYVAYDAANCALMDVDILNFDGAQFLYKMPVAIKDIAAGDIVIHQGVPMFVQNVVNTNKSLVVIDPVNGERKEIMLARSPFNFDYATKIVNFLGNMTATTASAENPFGNMWMLLAISGDNKDMSDILPLMMASKGNIDPMMMFFMMGNKDKNNMLPLIYMMSQNKTSNSVIPASN